MATHPVTLGSPRHDGTQFTTAYFEAKPAPTRLDIPALKTAHALLHDLRGLINPGESWLQSGKEIDAIEHRHDLTGDGYFFRDMTQLHPAYRTAFKTDELKRVESTSGRDLFGHKLRPGDSKAKPMAGAYVIVTACLHSNSACSIHLLQQAPDAETEFMTLSSHVADRAQTALFDLNLRQAQHPLDLIASRGTLRGQSMRRILNRYDS